MKKITLQFNEKNEAEKILHNEEFNNFDLELNIIDSKLLISYEDINQVSLALTDYIFKRIYDKDLLSRLKKQYYFFPNNEINEVYNIILKHKDEDKDLKNIINLKLLPCLKNKNFLNLEGFIRFQLREIDFELEDIIDRAIEIFSSEKEYKEFIRLLRYFVSIQEKKIDILKVHCSGENYTLFDKNDNDITEEIYEKIDYDEIKNVNLEDSLISILIYLNPKKIFLRKDDFKEGYLETCFEVFGKDCIILK